MNAKIHTYFSFGYGIHSEIELPELIPSNSECNVIIKLGKTTKNLGPHSSKGVRYQATKNQFLLEVDDIARYYLENGNKITIELYRKNVAFNEVRLFLLGSVFGAMFLQKGVLPIHGSSIKFGEKASIFTGLSGVGKSSIGAYFALNGFKFLNDDISVIDDNLKLQPGFPKMKLWEDVLKKLQIDSSSLSKIRPQLNKYHLFEKESFHNKPTEISHIFIISSKNTTGYEYQELKGIQKFNAIKNHTYRHRLISGLNQHADHFKILSNLIGTIKVYRISRPQLPINLDEMANFLLNTFYLTNA